MANQARTSSNRFDAAKRYFGRIYQYGKYLYDWDVNEHSEEVRYWLMAAQRALLGGINSGSSRLIGQSGRYHTCLQSLTDTTNNVSILNGRSIVTGRLVETEDIIELNDFNQNYVVTGEITSKSTVTSGVSYRLVDSEKKFTPEYKLSTCRIRFLSGDLAGNEYPITNLDAQTFTVSGDLTLLQLGDSYVIYPKALETPTEDDTVDTIYLVTWWEDISPQEDNNIENKDTQNTYSNLVNNALWDKPTNDAPSHRKQLRFCFWPNYGATTNTSMMDGFSSVRISTITRDTGVSVITSAQIDLLTEEVVQTLRVLTNQVTNGFNALIANTLTISNALTNNGTSQFNGINTFDGVCIFNADVTHNGLATFNDDVVMNGNVTMNGLVSLTGADDIQCVTLRASEEVFTNKISPFSGSDINIAANAICTRVSTDSLQSQGGGAISCESSLSLSSGKFLKADLVETATISPLFSGGVVTHSAISSFQKLADFASNIEVNGISSFFGASRFTSIGNAQNSSYVPILNTGLSVLQTKLGGSPELVSNTTDFWAANVHWDGSNYFITDNVNISGISAALGIIILDLDEFDSVDTGPDVPLNIQVTPIQTTSINDASLCPAVYLDKANAQLQLRFWEQNTSTAAVNTSFCVRISKMNNFNFVG